MKTDAVNPSISRSQTKIKHLTQALYGQRQADREVWSESDIDTLCHRLSDAIKPTDKRDIPIHAESTLWDESDIALITYGDSILSDGDKPLSVLHHFCRKHFTDYISWVHILPFFPWTSDDGFSVLDYSTVNQALGGWQDIEAIGKDFKLMADLVLNHCSSRSVWFENFKQGVQPGKDFFFSADDTFDVSRVVRPRTSELLQPVKTSEGEVNVWCTFSHDQIDFDFSNPEVLLEFVRIIRLYLDRGVRIFRLDAVAFTWKRSGTTCINLPEAHDLVRLLRALIESVQSDAVIITETNVPNIENLAYFGQRDEAHCIYNFALPPLLIHTLLEGDSSRMTRWLMSMPPAVLGTTYFNFIASHDGIGLRPVEGLLSEAELESIRGKLQANGALLSWRELASGEKSIYEVNVSLFDALRAPSGEEGESVDRMTLAHAILLGLEGVPAIYLHSFLGTRNDEQRVLHTGHNRAINRHQWDLDLLSKELDDSGSTHSQCLEQIKSLIKIRRSQHAFHPNATQFTLNCGRAIFAFWRQSQDRRQSIFCLYNISGESTVVPMSTLNLIGGDVWVDLITGKSYPIDLPDLPMAAYQAIWLSNLDGQIEGESEVLG